MQNQLYNVATNRGGHVQISAIGAAEISPARKRWEPLSPGLAFACGLSSDVPLSPFEWVLGSTLFLAYFDCAAVGVHGYVHADGQRLLR
jgi:hypothetical protein